MQNEKQLTPLAELIEQLDDIIEGIKIIQKIKPGFAQDILEAHEATKEDAILLLPKEKEGMIKLLIWYNKLKPSQKISVWSKNGEYSGLFEMDEEQIVSRYFNETYKQ